MTTDEVLERALSFIGYNVTRQSRAKRKTKIRRFKSHFGSHPTVYAELWEELQTTDIENARLLSGDDKHFKMFMMTLFYLKTYPLEDVLASRFDLHEQTCRKWIQFFVDKTATLLSKKVVWPDNWDTTFIITVDCVNFGINEPRHPTLHKDKELFDRKGGKGGKSGLRYKVALHLWENKIVWFNGPFPPNKGTDAEIYKEKGLLAKMPAGKKAIADKIYIGCDKIALHNLLDTDDVQQFKGRARARQESINARLKSFGCLKQRFCHGKERHQSFAHAVCVICVGQMENGSPLFAV